MKLVNPVGRDLTELETEAYSCHCVCSSASYKAQSRGFDEVYDSCECDNWEYETNLYEVSTYGIRKNN
ncbi:hypothetical protein BJV85_003355 [Clostridium acetobutylicum]|uniref:Uncharacterized protein n=1 Tax=Clostridium acetobutylicum (strain ATCC 824 / DSM 792 / JCM 1419 / IAM 19013 / LMG 5710 / NBRC 13948 / NRRL B-527 / VKM B-1787 / 2291 / W) TaxID=272562 RepID=Q97LA7_CLOAB|nr:MULTISPECIES: CA_C0660 family putative sactipeptide bacteriocin [Clostridium]AAK78632.1 Hypothetical protein, CF-26 family [Clostridium acetobutylicum ATCC 824]ADZ19706.1 conserved hypothetical protein [Clostridium acetobutylicum EA 2018]AEI31359.1 hypothetical protein SMB_G0669 [Clostridium acetobutylicum DSM 1731]AWV80355.1 hypothetical protein DK921_09660 [Clostridium acetobutylicum]MBC2392543.1 CA_C0660 family putative sactipeptide bacteriocin [Clostridium acetobutylicum]